MPEALEKWDCHLVEELLPQLYPIIVQINEALLTDLYQKNIPAEQIAKMKIIQNGMVHMAHLAVYASSYTNGVAAIHTQILKDTVLADWYKIWPERFFNETNGITQRRWLALCNPRTIRTADRIGRFGRMDDRSGTAEAAGRQGNTGSTSAVLQH